MAAAAILLSLNWNTYGIQPKLSIALRWQPATDGKINVISQVMDGSESKSNNTIDPD